MSDGLNELIKPVVEGLGCELWGIEHHSSGKHSTLKIFIDGEGGVDVEDCARISRQVSSLLDVENPISGEYTLEVSSPGMDRRLFSLEQFSAFAGSDVKITLKRPFDGRRKFSGRLRGLESGDVALCEGECEYLFPFEEIDRANVVPDFSFTGSSGGNSMGGAGEAKPR